MFQSQSTNPWGMAGARWRALPGIVVPMSPLPRQESRLPQQLPLPLAALPVCGTKQETKRSLGEIRMQDCWWVAEYVNLFTLVVLSITAGVIAWYSWETRRLRLATEGARMEAERAREIEFHPWLVGSNLTFHVPLGEGPIIHLPITNEGKTPALNISFDAEFSIEGKHEQSISHRNLFIAPNDTCHFRLVRLPEAARDKEARISVVISYSTHLNGSGAIKQCLEYAKGGWSNKEMEYSFILSTGQKYPI